MGLSILIARIVSVIYLSAALGAILSADYYRRLPDDLFRNAGLTYLTGFAAVVIGLLIVHYHNTWTKNWPVLITIIGWLALVKGVAVLVVPQFVHRLSAAMLADWGVKVFPYVALCLGLLFGYFGFARKAPPSQSLQPTRTFGPRDCALPLAVGVNAMLPPNTALLIIDVQKAIDHPSWGRRNNPRTEENISRLLSAWRRTGRPVLHVRHISREAGSTYRPGQEGCEFKPEAQPLEGEVVLTKHTNSAFIGTELEVLLRRERIFTLVICGVITNNSVEATARMAGNLGYETYVVSDATATFDKADFAGQRRSAEDVHALSLANLQGEYATVVSTADVLERV